jgi:hypothetical protein
LTNFLNRDQLRLADERPTALGDDVKKLSGQLAAAAVLAFALASSALASSHDPKGEFAQFAECPLNNAKVTECIYSVTEGDTITIGKKTLPLVTPITLQGGVYPNKAEEQVFVAAENGDTFSMTPQPVPGGLLGIKVPPWWPESFQEWFKGQIDEGASGLKATIELAAPTTAIDVSTQNLINQEGTTLGLPVKIKLDNPLLGSDCYIGSDSKPIQIDFTSGKSGSVEGSSGTLNFNKAYTKSTINGGRLVNGTFAAPSADGCGGIFSAYVDPLVDSVLGLPSASGENAAVLKGKLQIANAVSVKKSE